MCPTLRISSLCNLSNELRNIDYHYLDHNNDEESVEGYFDDEDCTENYMIFYASDD